jgi:hypothetical protein
LYLCLLFYPILFSSFTLFLSLVSYNYYILIRPFKRFADHQCLLNLVFHKLPLLFAFNVAAVNIFF